MKKQTTFEFLTRFPEILGKSNTTSSKDILINPINQGKQMTRKEKAEDLIDKFSERRKIFTETKGWVEYVNSSKAKRHALTAVDEILNSSPLEPNFADWDDCGGEHRYWYDAQKTQAFHYWQEVKQEIEKL